jgi:hypothetical protein
MCGNQLPEVELLAERKLALDAQAARREVTADGSRLGQQVLASYRGSDAALRRLDALQNPRRPDPGRGRKKAEPAPAAPDQAAQDTPTIVASDAAAGEPGVTTEVPADDPVPSAALDQSPDQDPASSAPRADEAILASESAPAVAAVLSPLAPSHAPERTTEDIPIPEVTQEELERERPELAAFQRSQRMVEATYGAGGTTGASASCRPSGAAVSGSGSGSAPGPDAPPGCREFTDEAILDRAPPSDPVPHALGRAPPGEGEG